MLKNNNQKAVKRLSERSLRQNRIRNIFVILAIVLTTFMFTTVFGIGFSVAQNTNVMWLRKQGTSELWGHRRKGRTKVSDSGRGSGWVSFT